MVIRLRDFAEGHGSFVFTIYYSFPGYYTYKFIVPDRGADGNGNVIFIDKNNRIGIKILNKYLIIIGNRWIWFITTLEKPVLIWHLNSGYTEVPAKVHIFEVSKKQPDILKRTITIH